ncbi:MAG: PDZ domain-containing protein, partial [Anaerovorax sp.]
MLQIKKRSLVLILVVALLTGGVLSAGGLLLYQTAGGTYVRVAEKDYERLAYMTQKYDKLEQLEQVIDDNYYKDVPNEDLELGIYKGLFWGLGDMYSNYLTAEEYENLSIYTQGEFQGIGVTISADDSGNIVVVSTIDGSPAQEAGLKTGDLITKVDGKTYTAA